MRAFSVTAAILALCFLVLGCDNSGNVAAHHPISRTGEVSMSLRFDNQTRSTSSITSVIVTVIGIEIVEPVVASLSKNPDTGIWSGTLQVPAGIDREFVVEASDDFQVMYRGKGVCDVVAGKTTNVTITACPDLETNGVARLALMFEEPYFGIGKISICLSSLTDPGQIYGSVISESQIVKQMEVIGKYCYAIRTLQGRTNNDLVAKYAQNYGIECWLDVRIGPDKMENDAAITDTIQSITNFPVAGVIIDDSMFISQDQGIAYIEAIKVAQPDVLIGCPVSVSEHGITQNCWIDNADVIFADMSSHMDWSMDQMSSIKLLYAKTCEAFPGKQVVVDKVGFPSSVDPVKQRQMVRTFVTWADQNAVKYFWFMMFDESYTNPDYPEGSNLGLFDKNLKVKPEIMKILF